MCNGIVEFFAGVEGIKDSTLDHTASPACKTFSESLLRHLHPLMSLALPNVEKNITVPQMVTGHLTDTPAR